MKKNTFLAILIVVVLVGCKTQDKVINNISCSGKITVQYDKIKRSDRGKPIAKKDLKVFTVYFINEFNDSIQGYVNNKLHYDKYLKIEDGSDNLKDYFGYNYSKDLNVPILKITSKTRNVCFDLEIDKRYKLIYVFFTNDGKWVVRFSNIYYIH
jgi:hypothetical protein